MSQVHYEDVSLKELVSQSEGILVVKKAIPFETVKEIKTFKLFKKCPPFQQVLYHFKVVEELGPNHLGPLEGREIEVSEAHYRGKLTLHRKYFLEGVLKSPIYTRYSSSANLKQDESIIIFISRATPTDYEFVAEGSYEAISKRKDIEKMIQEAGERNFAIPGT